MRATGTTTLNILIAIAALACISVPAPALQAQGARQREAGDQRSAGTGIRGRVVDASDAVLPGVAVSAVAKDGRALATTVTDNAGNYVLSGLSAGPVTLFFALDGFGPSKVALALESGDLAVPTVRLDLAPLADTVVVVGKAPVVQAPPPLPPLPQVTLLPVPDHDQESVCGPAKAETTTEALGFIVGRRYGAERGLYSKGDELTIRGGTTSGLEVGQNLAVRRLYSVTSGSSTNAGEHTAGMLQIVSIDEQYSTGVVIYACDEIMPNDFLAAVTPEPLREPDAFGNPDYNNAARILFADAGQMMGVPRRLMVIDRGSDRGIRPGQRLTLFQRGGHGTKPSAVGDAVVVAVRPQSATIRIERAMDAISAGDWAAVQRQLSARHGN